jgi:hypothetical protein
MKGEARLSVRPMQQADYGDSGSTGKSLETAGTNLQVLE